MDRGVKIAIFVASVAALCLGLIWDQVLSHARVIVEAPSEDALGPEVIGANIGSPDIARMHAPEEAAPWERPQPQTESAPAETEPPPAAQAEWLEYELKSGDNAWKLAHRIFPERGLKEKDILNANKDSKWRIGDKVRIPPGNAAPPANESDRPNSPTNTNGRAPIEYEVQQNDGWIRIAEKHADRGVTAKQVEEANPGVRLRPGVKVKIP